MANPNGARATTRPVTRLTPLETEVIQLFVQFSRALGQPRSVAEIYGLLFASPVPLSLNDVQERLDISLGSTSQGLQFLQELGAVRAVDLPQARRTHYVAVAELRNMAGRFLRRQAAVHLGDSKARMARITAQAQALTGEAKTHALGRVKTLEVWNLQGSKILPLLLKLLGGRNGR